MTVLLSPFSGAGQQFFDNNGLPLSGGKIYSYLAGTNTAEPTYSTSTGLIPHSNPITLDAAGRVPSGEIWLTTGVSYKFVLKTAAGILLGTYDNIIPINDASQTIFTGFKGQVGTLESLAGDDGADWIGYTPPGAGAVPESVADKLAQTVSVKDFGAKGDGVTPDDAAFTAALAASNNVNIPNGTYYLTSAIVLSSHQSLTGESVNGTILLFDGCDGVKGTNPVDTVQVSLTNLTLQLGASPSANTNVGVDAREWSYCTVKNVNVTHFQIGVYLARPNAGACWFNVFDTMYIHIANFGVLIDDPTYSVNSNWFLNINVDDIGQFSGGYGFHIQGYGNYFHNIYSGISGGTAGVYFAQVSGDNVIYGLYVESEPTYSIWQANGTSRTNVVLGFHLDSFTSIVRDDSGGLTFVNGSANVFPSSTQFGTDSTYHKGLVTVVVGDNTDGLKVTSSGNNRTNFKIGNTGSGGATWTFQTAGSGVYGSAAGSLNFVKDTTTAVTFDQNNAIKPGADGTQNLGTTALRWNDVYVKSGIVLTTPDGTKAYRLAIDNSGNVTTTLI